MRFLYFVILVAGSTLFAEEAPTAKATIAELEKTKMEILVIENSTFEQALDQITSEWEKRHPGRGFAVAVTDYMPPNGMRAEQPPIVSIKAKNVSFLNALRYLGDATKRRLRVGPGFLRMEEAAWIEEEHFTKSYPISPSLLRSLGLTRASKPPEISQAYRAYGVQLADWMELRVVGDTLEVFGYEREHQQIAGINLLLEQGYHISKQDPERSE